MRRSRPADRRVSEIVLLLRSEFCSEPFLTSADETTPFLICSLDVMIVAAYAVPAQATTSAVIETMSAGLGRRSFMILPLQLMCLL
jgi:hypothetical protein